MKRSSVNRYYMTISFHDTLVSKIRITKEQYDDQLKELTEQAKAHALDECPAEHLKQNYDRDGETITVHWFRCTTSEIGLEYHHCHEGYQFVTAKGKLRK